MKEKAKKRVGHILPAAVMLALIAALAVFALVFTRRGESVATAAARRDASAMTALNNACAYVSGRDFSTEIDGSVKARVFGIPYTQKVRGGRTVKGDGCDEFAESTSALVKAGLKKHSDGSAYSAAKGEYRKKSFCYGAPASMTKAEYIAAYGKPATGLCKYELDGAVVSAQCSGEGEYTFVLDPPRAAAYAKNEVKTLLGSKSYPVYESIELVLFTDGERPVRVVTREKFKVDKFGGTSCTAEYTETFMFP